MHCALRVAQWQHDYAKRHERWSLMLPHLELQDIRLSDISGKVQGPVVEVEYATGRSRISQKAHRWTVEYRCHVKLLHKTLPVCPSPAPNAVASCCSSGILYVPINVTKLGGEHSIKAVNPGCRQSNIDDSSFLTLAKTRMNSGQGAWLRSLRRPYPRHLLP